MQSKIRLQNKISQNKNGMHKTKLHHTNVHMEFSQLSSEFNMLISVLCSFVFLEHPLFFYSSIYNQVTFLF